MALEWRHASPPDGSYAGCGRPGARGGVLPHGLGWPTQGIIGQELENGAVAFFNLQPGLKLALWPRRSIAADTGLPAGPPNPTELTLGQRGVPVRGGCRDAPCRGRAS